MLRKASRDKGTDAHGLETACDSDPKIPTDRSFCAASAVVCAVAAGWPLLHGGALRKWFAFSSAALLLIGYLRPELVHVANVVVFCLSRLWGRIMTPIVAGLLYYVFFTPVGMLRRWFRMNAMRLRVDPDAPTYWIARPPAEPAKQSMLRQF